MRSWFWFSLTLTASFSVRAADKVAVVDFGTPGFSQSEGKALGDTYSLTHNGGRGIIAKLAKDGRGAMRTVYTVEGQVIMHLVLDDTYVYFLEVAPDLDNSAANVKRVAKDGSGSAELLAAVADSCGGLAVDALSVYWVQDGALFQAPKAQSCPTCAGTRLTPLLSTSPSGYIIGPRLALDGDSVYWSSYDGVSATIHHTSKMGGADLWTLAAKGPSSLVVSNEKLYWLDVTQQSGPNTTGQAKIMSVGSDGRTPETLVEGEGLFAFSVDEN